MIGALLRFAAGRWPEELREIQLAEWEGELYVLRSRSRARALWFAMSLALSPPVEDEHGVPRGWRELLPGLGRGLQPVLALLAVSLLCMLATGAVRIGDLLLGHVQEQQSLSPIRTDFNWVANGVTFCSLLAVAVLSGWLGGLLGGRLGVSWAHRTRLGTAGSAVVAPLVLATGVGLATSAIYAPDYENDSTTVWQVQPLWVVLAWGVLASGLGWTVVRVARSGRPAWAAALAVMGGLLALEVTAAVAGWPLAAQAGLGRDTAVSWFPLTLTSDRGSGVVFGRVEQGFAGSQFMAALIGTTVRALLVCTPFALRYGLAASRVVPRETPVRLPAARTVDTGRPMVRAFGLAATVLGVVGWAAGAAFATADTVRATRLRDSPYASGEVMVWVHELRLGFVVLIAAGLLVAMAGRGAVLLPVIVTAPALTVADALVSAANLHDLAPASGPVAFAVLAGAGLLGAGLCRWAGHALGRGGADPVSTRRVLAGAATLAAMCAPVLIAQAASVTPAPVLPAALPTGTAVVCGALAALAMVTACAASSRRLRPWFVVASASLIGLGMAGAGASTGAASHWRMLGAALGLPLVLLVVLVMRPVRGWIAALLAVGAVLLAGPVTFVQMLPSILFETPLMLLAGYSFPADGMPFLLGAVLIGTGLAVVVAVIVAPRPVVRQVVDPWVPRA
ncbi:hypothetical protein Lfu02_42330 [Longispora fulva]|uniref:Uncharacterized protein n=1 Tax=Longispora fulva TaxID=619741 RepID=A0A8J7KPU0_9ACTN|nr:hypothetical protein [Longispora fulva]MBG6136692.1 hypothetical protein [Longispora fulva]GIG59861.1 hypothetical protein Lfu02_42330 [Longispora fulva]